MRSRWIAALAAFLASAGFASAQYPLGNSGPVRLSTYDQNNSTSATQYPVNYFGDEATSAPRGWVSAEYLLWWIKDGPVSGPLVTTGDPHDPLAPGALGRPGTVTLFGANPVDYGTFSGARVTAGVWLDDERTFGLEASGFLLQQRSTDFNAGSNAAGNPPLYIPVFRADLNREGSFTISDPVADLRGSVAISSHSQLWGAEANGLINFGRQYGLSLDFLGGFRYLDLAEDLGINQNLFDPVNIVNDVIHDQFSTRNQFYGAQIGARLGYECDGVTVDLTGKLGLGASQQSVTINGATTEFGVGSPTSGTFPGGIFTQRSNIGRVKHDEFTVIPEVHLKVGYRLTRQIQAFVGYDFLYWSQVVRPGSQIDGAVNPTQTMGGTLLGPALPAPQFNRTDFWAQGVMFGLEFQF